MSGSRLLRWLPIAFLLAAHPATPQSQLALNAPDSIGENTATSTAGEIAFRDRGLGPLPKLSPEEMGDLLEVRQRYQAAIESYSEIENPSASIWNKMGIAYQMMFDLKDAARCYKESLKIDPKNPSVLNNLATVQDATKDYPAAERTYRKSLKINPNSAIVLKNLGTNLLMQHQYDKGAEAYKQALALDPHIFESRFGPKVNDPAPKNERGTAAYFKARSCARAGLNDCAINFLIKAFNEGGATVKKVAEEADFASLRGTPALARLLANEQ